jgi:hypothetical protein
MRSAFRFLACLCLPPAAHALAFVALPTAPYTSATTLVAFGDPDESMLPSISDGVLTVAFSTPMRASTVGDNWATWGSPPQTEFATPRVLWSGLDDNFDPIVSVTFTLSVPVAIFGFEAEPGPTDTHTLVASFFQGGNLRATLSLDVSGNGGAVLFAAMADQGSAFDSVTLASDADWAAGQFRYAAATAAPEPWSIGLAAPGLFVICISRKQRGENR